MGPVKARLTIRCFLILLAIVGLMLAPVARPALAVAMDMQTTDGQSGTDLRQASDGMPCCPEQPAQPACGKDCPLMALCVGTPLHGVSATEVGVRRTSVEALGPHDRPGLLSITRAPPQRPPEI
jgi:hypothetical protein